MTTSSDQTPSTPKPNHKWASGEHWYEMTATLSPKSKDRFGKWVDAELAYMEDELDRFITPNSLRKSLRRSA